MHRGVFRRAPVALFTLPVARLAVHGSHISSRQRHAWVWNPVGNFWSHGHPLTT
ncbi:MAG: hypothetical protein ACO3QB_13610 [bacterium]